MIKYVLLLSLLFTSGCASLGRSLSAFGQGYGRAMKQQRQVMECEKVVEDGQEKIACYRMP